MLEGPSCDGQRDHADGSRERTQPTMAWTSLPCSSRWRCSKPPRSMTGSGRLGFDVGTAWTAFWTAFLRSLRLAAWPGSSLSSPTPTAASRPPSVRACWAHPGKRCRDCFLRNGLAQVPKARSRWSPRSFGPSSPARARRCPRATRRHCRHARPVVPGGRGDAPGRRRPDHRVRRSHRHTPCPLRDRLWPVLARRNRTILCAQSHPG